MTEIVKAYKVFDPDWKCRDFQFEVGKTYQYEDKLEICQSGFHACRKLVNCFNYRSFDPKNKVAEVECSGELIEDNDKLVCSEIKLIKELSWHAVLDLCNSGNRNSGYGNSGDENSGDENSGDENSGDRNSGDGNSGDRNSGDRNSGNWNSGYGNSGDYNSGYRNSGNWNSGDGNSGNWNSCSRETGYFNSTESKTIRVFNKPCDRQVWEESDKPGFFYFEVVKWISRDRMTKEEKEQHPDYKTTQGYLKALDYKEAWKDAYSTATKEDIRRLKALPNFDAKVFEEITGINVEEEDDE